MKRKLAFLKDQNNPPPKKQRLLDLKNMEHFSNFNMYKHTSQTRSKRAPKTFRAPQGGMIDIDHSYIVLLHVDVVGTTPNLRSGFGGSFRWKKDWKK